MNKLYTLILLSGAAMSANAQQINGSFDAQWTSCTPWDSKDNTTAVGTQPEGWHISNVYASGVKTVVGDSIEGSTQGSGAVKLTNKSIMGQKIPAYLTLGTPWATANVMNLSKTADGGTFGGQAFTYHPDAISFDYKRDNSHGDENATVVAYLWKGQWTQKDVPGNTVIVGKTTPVDMVNRDRNILGMATTMGGDTVQAGGAALIASLQQPISEGTNDEWKSMTIPFSYADSTAKVENINVIFSATDYFADRNGIVDKNSLSIDNVKLLYYHKLTSLTTTDADGNASTLEPAFSEDVYNYTAPCTYDEYFTTVTHDVLGIGASVDEEYDDETAQLTITVKGEDYDEETNPDSKTVYTIQYVMPSPTLSSLVVGSHEFIAAGGDTHEFTATGRYCEGEVSCTSAAADTIEQAYDAQTGVLTVTLHKKGAADGVYTITFEGGQKEAVYQIPDADFEDWASDNALTEGWNSFDTASGLFNSFASMSPLPTKIEGYNGGNGVRIMSKDLWLAYANGNLTTGHINMGSYEPTDASNFNYTDRTDKNGNLPFAGKPDAFEVYARFTPGTAKADSIVLQGRVQLILHGDTAYHDPEVADMADIKVASASVLVPATDTWTRFTGNFQYTGNEPETMYMLASATTNPVPGASKDDQFDIDALHLIYYHTLKAITLDGKLIEGFDPEKTDYTIQGDINQLGGSLSYEKKAVGGYVDTELNMETGVATITVYGDDYKVNADSKTVYTVKFDNTATGIGSITAGEAQNHTVYTLSGVRVSGKPAAGLYIIDGKKMLVK